MSKNKKTRKIKRRRYSKAQAATSDPEKTAIEFYGVVTQKELDELTDEDRKAMSKGTSEWRLHCAAKRYRISKNGKSNVIPGICVRLPDGTSRPATYDDIPEDDRVFEEHWGKFAATRSITDAEKVLTIIDKRIKLAKQSNELETIKRMKNYKNIIESVKKIG